MWASTDPTAVIVVIFWWVEPWNRGPNLGHESTACGNDRAKPVILRNCHRSPWNIQNRNSGVAVWKHPWAPRRCPMSSICWKWFINEAFSTIIHQCLLVYYFQACFSFPNMWVILDLFYFPQYFGLVGWLTHIFKCGWNHPAVRYHNDSSIPIAPNSYLVRTFGADFSGPNTWFLGFITPAQ